MKTSFSFDDGDNNLPSFVTELIATNETFTFLSCSVEILFRVEEPYVRPQPDSIKLLNWNFRVLKSLA